MTVIDTSGGPSKPETVVVISGNRITSVAEEKKARVPKDAEVIDATGKFLIPGLWDMHAHVAFTATSMEQRLPLLIANGITGIRDMGGSLDLIKRFRKEIEAGTRVGPRIVAAGPILDGPGSRFPRNDKSKRASPSTENELGTNFYAIVSNPTEARQDVDALKQDGVDFIKVYDFLSRDSYYSIAEESKKLNIPFAGHVPYSVTPEEASDAGQKSIEHLTQVVLACSSREAELRAQWEQLPKPAPTSFSTWQTFNHIETISLESYSLTKAKQLFALFVKNGTWQTPTLAVLRSGAFIDDPHFRDDPRVKYMSPATRRGWDPDNLPGEYKSMDTPEYHAEKKELYIAELNLVGAMQRAGVGILSGTDMGNPYCFPGFSTHDDLELMVQAGLTPMQALQTATINPVRYLGKEKDLGTVAAGKFADLVLLDADPLADIRNTTQIDAVVVNGRLFRKDSLQNMLTKVEETNKGN